jgi:endonuclease/exonuclease/phosphatase family metal-dependent hydrolase
MARPRPPKQLDWLKLLKLLPPNLRIPAVVAVVVVVVVIGLVKWARQPKPFSGPVAGPGEYLFCFWNVENLFDDQDDRRGPIDREYDDWFAHDAEARRHKLDRLTEALVRMNGGRGPDIFACCEVESLRAAELLKEALNARLPEGVTRYENVVMKEVAAGRHIAPAVITRLPVAADRTRLYGAKLRIVETHIAANDRELVLVAAHWTSQLQQREGGHGEEGREKYADQIHGAFRAMTLSNPDVDFLVCGDFNDTPDSEPVTRNLRATGDRNRVLARESEPLLLDLLAGKDPRQFGTLFYDGRPLIYDHICVSPGMLDEVGWSCDPESVYVVTDGLIRPGSTVRRPWRFGNQKDDEPRGYSDHFPVMVRLKVR